MMFLNQEKKKSPNQASHSCVALWPPPMLPHQRQGHAECCTQTGEEEMQLGDVSGGPNMGDEKGQGARWSWSPP